MENLTKECPVCGGALEVIVNCCCLMEIHPEHGFLEVSMSRESIITIEETAEFDSVLCPYCNVSWYEIQNQDDFMNGVTLSNPQEPWKGKE